LLPAFIDDLPLPHELELLKTLHSIIKFSSSGAENETAAFVSCFFRLLCQVDGITREYLGSKAQRGNYYIKKVDYIIESSYGEKVTLQSVAAELNISPVYLSAVYKSGCGINFSEQLLNVRMRHAERMLLDQNIPTAKVAELCGFCDENYFRKKFRQFFGMNVREYRKIKNGVTLYHKKPQNMRQG